jgi:hypothetical protein
MLHTVINGIERTLVRNEPLFKEPTHAHSELIDDHIESPVTAQIVLVTAGACASACLDFIDILRELAPLIHVGHSTNSDTAYLECRSVPSKKALLNFPIKVYRNRLRKPYQKYHPTHTWEGDIADTQSLKMDSGSPKEVRLRLIPGGFFWQPDHQAH